MDRVKAYLPYGIALVVGVVAAGTAVRVLHAPTEGPAVVCPCKASDCCCPKPKPGPNPEPEPAKPSPFAEPGLRVLVVYETADESTLPAKQAAIFTSGRVRAFLNEKAVAYRFFDADADTKFVDPAFAAAMRRERKTLPWVVVGNGKTGTEEALPADPDAFIQLVSKFAE